MARIVKFSALIVSVIIFISLVSCTINEHVSEKEIEEKATQIMECVVDEDADKLFTYFNSDMKSDNSKQSLKEIQQLFDYIDGNIVFYDYKGVGGSEEDKHDGHIYTIIAIQNMNLPRTPTTIIQ